MIGKILDGRYCILQLLGEGGMGSVYAATHLGTGRRVAIKVIAEELMTSPEMVIRFEREARAIGAVDTEYIVQIFDAGQDERLGISFMVMELLTGGDLRAAIGHLGPMHPELALRIGAQTCIGLQQAHDAGVVHRDIKPGNLFLSRRHAEETTVKILDFGIAKIRLDQTYGAQGVALTRTGHLLGSPAYASPEQAKGLKTIDHRTDIWSLGAVLYEMLTGQTPHGELRTFGQIMIALCSEPVRPLQDLAPWVSAEVAAVVHGALTIDVNRRISSASAMLDALRRLLPRGWWLSDRMFVPLAPELRSHRAPKHREASDTITISKTTRVDPRRGDQVPPSLLHGRRRI